MRRISSALANSGARPSEMAPYAGSEPVVEILTVDQVVDPLRERIAIERLGCVSARQPSPSLPSMSR